MLPCRSAVRQLYNAGSATLPLRYPRRAISFPNVRAHSRFFTSQNPIPAFSYVQPQVGPDTIFALSTAPGKAGVAVIRISGKNAEEAVLKMTHMKKLPAPRQAMLKKIYHPSSKELLDKGIVLWFPGPQSYTGEDTAEFHIHGGNAVTRSVLDALGSMTQYRIADRGEFSRRAFDNDKLDLTELEGLADLLNAETEMQRKLALRQAEGSLRQQYDGWREQLIKCMALTEAVIDFGEDENIEDGVLNDVFLLVERLRESIKAHLNDNRVGEILRDGIHITISGPPNAGKSSFLNTLARREAAIVSDIPGTTRDVVEVSLNLGGYPVVLSDTAGLRESSDVIEMEGVKRAMAKISNSDMHICLLPLPDIESFEELNGHKILNESITPDTILIINKSDASSTISSKETIERLAKTLGVKHTWLISCKTGEGIDQALESLIDLLKQRYESATSSSALITQARHRFNLSACLAALDMAADYATSDIVLAAEELRQAASAIGRITGKVDVEQVLDMLFSEFCIGK
ncbi:tRNA modification GTPase TrmE [Umbelopsis sp. AD052]|nr:tRNA modification GTPase TrmE [Umbelopsis sp. AD052]